MADFVGLLKKTIDVQSNATPELRQRIYTRARLTVEKKLADSNVAPEVIALQRKVVEKAIREVEEFYSVAEASAQSAIYLPEEENKNRVQMPSAQSGRDVTEFIIGQAATGPQTAPYVPLAEEDTGIKAEEGRYVVHTAAAEPSGAMFALPENGQMHDVMSGTVPEDDIPPVDDPLPDERGAREEKYNKDGEVAFPVFAKPGFVEDNLALEPAVLPNHFSADDTVLPVRAEPAYQESDRAEQDYGYHQEPAGIDHSGQFLSDVPVPDYDSYAREEYSNEPDFLPYRENTPELYSEQTVRYETDVALPVSAAGILPAPVQPTAGQHGEQQQIAPVAAAITPQLAVPLPEQETDLPLPELAVPEPVFAGRTSKPLQPLMMTEEPERVNHRSGDFDLVSDIFAQAAIREKKRSGKKRLLLAGGIIVVVLVLGASIVWFLTGFLQHKEASQTAAAIVINEQPVPEQAGSAQAKLTQRLLPDGRETDPGSAGAQSMAGKTANQTISAAPSPVADAMFYEARTSLLPETLQAGTVEWSILHETSENNGEEMAIRGEVQIPDKDMKLLLTIRRNTDASIPAAYLAELVFVMPENFDGEAVDRIGQLVFKASERSMGQELQGTIVPIRINDNFFFMTINAPGPFLEHNLDIMRQLPWIKLNIQYKNGRYGEFSIAKGEGGDAIFKQVIDNWRAKGNGTFQNAQPAGGR